MKIQMVHITKSTLGSSLMMKYITYLRCGNTSIKHILRERPLKYYT
jgi:hypothetical protein